LGQGSAAFGQGYFPPGHDHKLGADQGFQPLDLQRNGRLRPAEDLSRARITAKVYDRDQSPQQVAWQVYDRHELMIMNVNSSIITINFVYS
jgi:hypothetical protein